MAAHVIIKEDDKKLREIFMALDKNNDGQLSLDELLEGHKLLDPNDLNSAREQAERMMKTHRH